MNATDDIDIAIPCVRLSLWDTPELCQVKTAKRTGRNFFTAG